MAGPFDWMIPGILEAANERVVENQLFDLEVQLSVAGPEQRLETVNMLRDAASQCAVDVRAERLLLAADAIAAGQTCARNEQGLTLEEAKAVQTISLDEWEKLAPYWPTDRPPEIPHLSMWDFFSSLVVRVAQGFRDFDGAAVAEGEMLHFRKLDHFPYDDGYTITFDEKVIRLSGNVEADSVVLENGENQFFEPVASVESLRACYGSIQSLWGMLDVRRKWQAPIVRGELDACGRWLAEKGERDEPYVCTSAPLLPSLFPERTVVSERLVFQITFLFAGMVRCPDGRTPPGT